MLTINDPGFKITPHKYLDIDISYRQNVCGLRPARNPKNCFVFMYIKVNKFELPINNGIRDGRHLIAFVFSGEPSLGGAAKFDHLHFPEIIIRDRRHLSSDYHHLLFNPAVAR
jgi:hypothetical protein